MNIQEAAARLRDNVGKILVGSDNSCDLILMSLLVSGHILLEDVPGTGKTTLAKAIAQSLDLSFKRIQFTPDLMPSDLTGIHFYNQAKGIFEFRPGPLFSQLVLADEINRAAPRTQSSLLEAMEERDEGLFMAGGYYRRLSLSGLLHPDIRPCIDNALQKRISYCRVLCHRSLPVLAVRRGKA